VKAAGTASGVFALILRRAALLVGLATVRASARAIWANFLFITEQSSRYQCMDRGARIGCLVLSLRKVNE
jgi:hypothetical protein